MVEVSIILLTKNAGNYFGDTLQAIFDQQTSHSFEVLVIDSGSTDETLSIVKKFSIRLHKIKPEEFGHGKTRNYSATLAKGRYLVFLTQDAVPATSEWLEHLIKPFTNKQVVGVYARQIPKPNASPSERFFLLKRYPDKAHRKRFNQRLGPVKLDDIFFSNVCSAIRKKTLMAFPFDEQLIMSEDQEWAKEVLLAGHSIAYQPEAVIQHSHNYSLRSVFRRFFDSGVSFAQMKQKGNFQPKFTKDGLSTFKEEVQYMLSNGHGLILPYVVIYDTMKYIGMELGMKNKKLPLWLNKHLSQHRYFWNS
jgi:rhamnosyltransferase